MSTPNILLDNGRMIDIFRCSRDGNPVWHAYNCNNTWFCFPMQNVVSEHGLIALCTNSIPETIVKDKRYNAHII